MRSGSVGFRLALIGVGRFALGMRGKVARLRVFVVLLRRVLGGVVHAVKLPGLVFVAVVERDDFLVNAGDGADFAGQNVDGSAAGDGRANLSCRRVGVAVAMVVVVEVFEDVADIEESVAVEADVDESRLHAGKNAGDFTFVDAADEGELFFALDVDFD